MKLYMVSLGPGDYELITIKALKALKNCDAICVPTKSPDHSFTRSMTHKIIQKLMEEFEFEKPLIPMYTPMHFKKKIGNIKLMLLQILLQNIIIYLL